MVRAAVADQPGFVVDDREIRREGALIRWIPCATCARSFPERSLCLIVGMDAFLGLPQWHEWRDVLELAHVVVAHRPGWRAPRRGRWANCWSIAAPARRRPACDPAGRIFIQPVTQLEISSTDLRDLIVAGRDPRYLMPDAVRDTDRGIRLLLPPAQR